LVYLTQAELVTEIFEYAKENPMVQFEVFVDKVINEVPENVHINPISSSIFIQKMTKCSGIISTAGFESICEAMYLGKPALMVPIKKHYEQLCNAHDAERAKAGIYAPRIDVNLFMEYLKQDNIRNHQDWINQSESIFMRELGLNNVTSNSEKILEI
jgi:uncharacterized protein (TIGR00661 family)